MYGILKGEACIEAVFKKEALARLTDEDQESCAKEVADAVLLALQDYVSIDEDITGDDLVEAEDAYMATSKVICHVEVSQSCNVWSDPSVGIETATDDEIEIPSGFLSELKERLKDSKYGLSDALELVNIKISDEELIEIREADYDFAY